MANPSSETPYRTIAAAHIRELSRINETLPPILTHGATSISLLTTSPILSQSSLDSPAHRRDTLHITSRAFISLVTKLSPALKAQIDALETESIIPEKAAKKNRITAAPQVMHGLNVTQIAPGGDAGGLGELGPPPEAMADYVTNEGLGEWDVGVLNARAGIRQAGPLEDVLERVEVMLKEMVKKEEKEEG